MVGWLVGVVGVIGMGLGVIWMGEGVIVVLGVIAIQALIGRGYPLKLIKLVLRLALVLTRRCLITTHRYLIIITPIITLIVVTYTHVHALIFINYPPSNTLTILLLISAPPLCICIITPFICITLLTYINPTVDSIPQTVTAPLTIPIITPHPHPLHPYNPPHPPLTTDHPLIAPPLSPPPTNPQKPHFPPSSDCTMMISWTTPNTVAIVTCVHAVDMVGVVIAGSIIVTTIVRGGVIAGRALTVMIAGAIL